MTPEHVVTLRDGREVILATSISFARRRAVILGFEHRRSKDPDVSTMAEAEIVAAMVEGWPVLDGGEASLPPTYEMVAELDARDVDALFALATRLFAEGTAIESKADASSGITPPAQP